MSETHHTPTKKFKVASEQSVAPLQPVESKTSNASVPYRPEVGSGGDSSIVVPVSPIKEKVEKVEKVGTIWHVPKPKLFKSGMEPGPQTVSKLNSDSNIHITASRASHSAGYRQG